MLSPYAQYLDRRDLQLPNLRRHHYAKLRASGKEVRRRHNHMHTRKQPGINVSIVENTEQSVDLSWMPPLVPSEGQGTDLHSETNTYAERDIDALFSDLSTLR